MIVQPINRNVQVSDAMQRTRATMLASPEMLRRAILPYTKLELAAVRETINNAADSSTKLAIQIPTILEPVVRIRDYGPGIPVAQIYNFYSVAGYSTKTQTNVTTDENGNEIHVMGCKGVGRFAPLGVTEQFTFHNYVDGRCIVGQVFFDSEGYPTVDILDDSPSSEPSGVEISFAVDPKQTGEFRNAFHECLVNFPDHYDISFLGEPIDVVKPQPKVSGTNWYLDDDSGIIMGRIKYDVNAYELLSYSNQLYSMLNSGLVLRVPLGSIDVNDARESIVYNDRTKKAIQQAAATALAEYQASLDKAFANVTSHWDACILYSEMTSADSRFMFGQPKWKGTQIGAWLSFVVPHSDIVSVGIEGRRRRRRSSVTSADPELPQFLTPRSREHKGAQYHIHPHATTIILVDDDKQYVRRLAYAYEDKQSILHQHIPDSGKVRHSSALTVFVYDPAKLQDVLDALGGAKTYLKISDLPLPPAKPKVSKGPRAPATIAPYVYDPLTGNWAKAKAPLDLNDTNIVWCEWHGTQQPLVTFDPKQHPQFTTYITARQGSGNPALTFSSVYKVLLAIDPNASFTYVALTKPLRGKVGKTKWRAMPDVVEPMLDAFVSNPAVRRGFALLHAADRGQYGNNFAAIVRSNDAAKYLKALKLPEAECRLPFNSHVVDKSWRDDAFVKDVIAALADRPLFQYLAYNANTPTNLIVNYLKEGK